MTDDKVVLDTQIFSALSSDTRINILKKLDSKHMTSRKHPSGANQMLATAKQEVVPIS